MSAVVQAKLKAVAARVNFETHPDAYRHWRLTLTGPVATLAMDVAEEASLLPGYRLKLNSYDLGVDIELANALDRIRFEHREVHCVVVTGARERLFCSGANIYMLGLSSHAWKVNFCKFTNETCNGMEDSSAHDGIRFLAAVNGSCAGGYELALACDEILLIDDRSSAVSLPEVSLLGLLPGTGGLTRLTDKRNVRRDLADIFCTTIPKACAANGPSTGSSAGSPPGRTGSSAGRMPLGTAARSRSSARATSRNSTGPATELPSAWR